MKLLYGAQTDVGQTREHNEDNFGVADDDRIGQFGHLFIVCDGIGGYLAGEVASKLAVDTILKTYYDQPGEQRSQVLSQTLHIANQVVHEQGRGSMGTTCVAALFYGGTLFMANVGDSRGYLFRGSQIRQITNDHSFVAEQVRAGLMTPEQARISNVKNIITRAIGHQPEVQVDIFREALQPNDSVLLCSDGLHGLVEDEELAQLLREHAPQEAVDRMVDLANARGGSDNITAVVVHVQSIEPAPLVGDTSLLASLIGSAPTKAQHSGATTEPLMADRAGRDVITERLEPIRPTSERTAAAPSTQRPAQPAARRAERGLNKTGLLLTLLLLLVLSGFGLFLVSPGLLGLNQTPAAAPATATPTIVPTSTAGPGGTPEGQRPANQGEESTSAPSLTEQPREKVEPFDPRSSPTP